MKCVIYARVSSKEQEKEGFSIPAQLKLLKDYANKNRFKVAQEFIDVETAKRTGRVNFEKMVAFLKSNPDTRAILVEKTDRLYRNFRDYVTMEELDVEIHLVKESEVISKDSRSHAKFIHGIKVLMAKNYIDNLSEEVKKGLTEKAEQGEWPGRAPFGYINNIITRCVEEDPDRAQTVRRLFQLYASGEYSLSNLKNTIKSEGVRSRNGYALSKSMVEMILKNPFYYGDFIWNGQFYKGTHLPIISRELFDAVQDMLRRDGKPKRQKDRFPFAGLLKCGHCGCQITAELKKGKYVYYHCTGGKGKCSQPYVRQEILDKKFAEIVKAIEIGPELVNWIIEALKSSHEEEKRYRESELKRLNRDYNNLQIKIDKSYEDRLNGVIDEGYWIDLSTRWRKEQEIIRSIIVKFEVANQDYIDHGTEILELAQSAYSQYIKQNHEEKRRLLKSVLSNCTIDGLILYPTYRQPFNYIAEGVISQIKYPRQDSNLLPSA